MAWINENLVWILTAIIALDNALAAVPVIAANSTFQLISGWIKSFAGMFLPKP
jgi:hypothetical protein